MATNDKNKKPLVTLDAANPAPSYQGTYKDYATPTNQVGAGWADNQSGPIQQTLEDNTPSLTEDQVRQAKSVPGHLSESNKVPGSGEVKLNETAKNMGVWEGTPEAMGYDRMFEELNRRHPAETDEEKRERLKRQRRNQLFAAIGDGISALSNLYFTTKGSPSADQSKSMSKALRDRYDKEDKDRENDEKSNLTSLLNIMNQKRLAHTAWLNKKNQAELIELRKKAAEAGNLAALRRVDELRRYHSELAAIEREKAEAERKRKDEETQNRIENNNKRTKIAEDKKNIYGSRVANQNATGASRTANANKNADRRTAIQAAKAAKSGSGGGAPHYNTSESVVWYDDQGQKHTRTVKSNTSTGKQGQAKPKKKLRKNNMGL